MLMSSTIASGRVSVALRSASAPSTAVDTVNPDEPQPTFQRGEHVGVVVNDEDPGRGNATGCAIHNRHLAR